MSDFRALSTWSNWTGVVVRDGRDRRAVVELRRAREPGARSTKKLPSRKIRGRIFAAASARTGRPASRIAIVTVADCAPGLVCCTFVTSPTSTPAIRTGECGLMPGRVAERRLDLVGLVDERDVLGERRGTSRAPRARAASRRRRTCSVRGRASWQHRGSDPGRLGGERLALGDARAALVRRALVARRAAVRVDARRGSRAGRPRSRRCRSRRRRARSRTGAARPRRRTARAGPGRSRRPPPAAPRRSSASSSSARAARA